MLCNYCSKEKKVKVTYWYKGNEYCSMKCIYTKENIPEWNKYDRSIIKSKVERIVNTK